MTVESRMARIIADRKAEIAAAAARRAAADAAEIDVLLMLQETLTSQTKARVTLSNVRTERAGTLLQMPRAWLSFSDCDTQKIAMGLVDDGWTPAPSCWAAYGPWAGSVRPVAQEDLPTTEDKYMVRESMPALPYWYELSNFGARLWMFLTAPDGGLYRVGIEDREAPVSIHGTRYEEPGDWHYHSPTIRYHNRVTWNSADCDGIAEAVVLHKQASGQSVTAQLVWKRLTHAPVSIGQFTRWLERRKAAPT